jgi:hypothetical protein
MGVGGLIVLFMLIDLAVGAIEVLFFGQHHPRWVWWWRFVEASLCAALLVAWALWQVFDIPFDGLGGALFAILIPCLLVNPAVGAGLVFSLRRRIPQPVGWWRFFAQSVGVTALVAFVAWQLLHTYPFGIFLILWSFMLCSAPALGMAIATVMLHRRVEARQ